MFLELKIIRKKFWWPDTEIFDDMTLSKKKEKIFLNGWSRAINSLDPEKRHPQRDGGVAVASAGTSCLRAVPQSRILGLAFF